MKLITGVSGRTGGEVATTLLSKNERIRVLVRSDKDAKKWFERGAEITLGDFFDADSVSLAFDGIESAYIMTPPLAHSNDLMRDRLIIETNIVNACQKHQPKNIVCLSAFGAHLKMAQVKSQGCMKWKIVSLPLELISLHCVPHILWKIGIHRFLKHWSTELWVALFKKQICKSSRCLLLILRVVLLSP